MLISRIWDIQLISNNDGEACNKFEEKNNKKTTRCPRFDK